MITPIPNIPTDNLYKFIFISGLSIILTGVILFITQSTLINEQIDYLNFEIDKLEAENEFFLKDLENLGISNQKEIETKKRQIALKETDIKLSIKKTKVYLNRLIVLSLFIFVLILIGIWITRSGYKKWYELVQKPIDERTKIELEILKEDKTRKISCKNKEGMN